MDALPPFPDDVAEVPATTRRPRGTAAQLVMAVMLGLVDAFGFERAPTETVQLAPDLTTGDLPLGFGPLPPLD